MMPEFARVFISATTNDLKSYRQAVANLLITEGVLPVTQDYLEPSYQALSTLLREKIDGCDAVICLIGFSFGRAPTDRPDRSWTQIEYDISRELAKPTFVFVATPACPPDHPLQEGEHERQMQLDYHEELRRATDVRRHPFSEIVELERLILRTIRGILQVARRRRRPAFDIAHMPVTSCKTLLGRESELKKLDSAWERQRTHVVCVVAPGGIGKTSLINRWLADMSDRIRRRSRKGRADSVYAWSFYRNSTDRNGVISAAPFIDHALTEFGDPDPTAGVPGAKGHRLAKLVLEQRTLLVLDGLEPLQQRPDQGGRLKPEALSVEVLLRELAAAPDNSGLCVISSRQPVPDLNDWEDKTVQQIDLANLSADAGAELLKEFVSGSLADLRKASKEFHGHSLALALLGGSLRKLGCDISKRYEVRGLLESDNQLGGHAERVMDSYEQWFGGGPALNVLSLLGLFDRPAEPPAVDALRQAPSIPGLNDSLLGLSDLAWNGVLKQLRDTRFLFLSDRNSATPDALDAHPLVREHFGRKLRDQHPDAFRQGNSRLYEHFKATKDEPTTAGEMTPLFLAVAHGCAAGRHLEALEEVYWKRIMRGETYFSTDNLNAFENDRAAVSRFFSSQPNGEPDWRRPLGDLPELWKARVLRAAGWDLRGLGQMKEACQAFRGSLESYVKLNGQIDIMQDPESVQAIVAASQLSQISLDCGELSKSLAYAEQNLVLAEQSGLAFWMAGADVLRALVLFRMGRLAESESASAEIEAGGIPDDAGDAVDHAFIAFRYCDLLLERAELPVTDGPRARWIFDRVEQSCQQIERIAWKEERPHPANEVAVLLRGRAHLMLGLRAGEEAHLVTAEQLLNEAITLLRAGPQELYLSGLLARATLLSASLPHTRLLAHTAIPPSLALHFRRIDHDLNDVRKIAGRGQMMLYLVDSELQGIRLELLRGKKKEVDKKLQHLRKKLKAMAYDRRLSDLSALEASVRTSPAD